MYQGHTTRLVPHGNDKPVPPRKKQQSKFFQAKEHMLILLVLFLFSMNIMMLVAKFYLTAGMVDGIPYPDFTASISNIFIKFFSF